LKSTQLEHWAKEDKNIAYLRTDEQSLRAVLTERFKPYDNADFLRDIEPTLEGVDYKIQHTTITDELMVVGIVTNGTEDWSMGLVLYNSEVGVSSIRAKVYLHSPLVGEGVICEELHNVSHTKSGRENVDGWLRECFMKVEHMAEERLAFMAEFVETKCAVETEMADIGIPLYVMDKVLIDMTDEYDTAGNLLHALLGQADLFSGDKKIKTMEKLGSWISGYIDA
jgi:hypothetical protein